MFFWMKGGKKEMFEKYSHTLSYARYHIFILTFILTQTPIFPLSAHHPILISQPLST